VRWSSTDGASAKLKATCIEGFRVRDDNQAAAEKRASTLDVEMARTVQSLSRRTMQLFDRKMDNVKGLLRDLPASSCSGLWQGRLVRQTGTKAQCDVIARKTGIENHAA